MADLRDVTLSKVVKIFLKYSHRGLRGVVQWVDSYAGEMPRIWSPALRNDESKQSKQAWQSPIQVIHYKEANYVKLRKAAPLGGAGGAQISPDLTCLTLLPSGTLLSFQSSIQGTVHWTEDGNCSLTLVSEINCASPLLVLCFYHTDGKIIASARISLFTFL